MSEYPIETKFSEHKTSCLIRCSGCNKIIPKNTVVTKKTECYSHCEWDSYFCKNCFSISKVEVKL